MIVLVDTGVLIALIDPDTREHQWAQERAKRLPQPFQTSEPVLTESPVPYRVRRRLAKGS
jgi:predicted nucleic acid-binding protein